MFPLAPAECGRVPEHGPTDLGIGPWRSAVEIRGPRSTVRQRAVGLAEGKMADLNEELANARPVAVAEDVTAEVHFEEHVGDPREVLPLPFPIEQVPVLEEDTAAPDIHAGARPFQRWHDHGGSRELLLHLEAVPLEVMEERELDPTRHSELARCVLEAPPALVDDVFLGRPDVPGRIVVRGLRRGDAFMKLRSLFVGHAARRGGRLVSNLLVLLLAGGGAGFRFGLVLFGLELGEPVFELLVLVFELLNPLFLGLLF